jgi:hypothetical protein
VEEKAGDWEGDTVKGAGKTAYIVAFVNKNNEISSGNGLWKYRGPVSLTV